MSADGSAHPPNPFVGPRPFVLGEPLFGRDRELRELRNLLVAERILVLYSPSGAGKTSLVQAGLIPRMLAADFHVLPVIRVNEPPPERNGDGTNRYVQSALHSLERDAPGAGQRATAGDGPRLSEALAERPRPDDPVADLLIFDQFEEVLTLDPTDTAAKTEFFAQVGEALRVKDRWALFSMREEYVAALEPYLRHIPTRLAATYRLDLLNLAAAAEAIQKPAAKAGVAFADDAAAGLIDELVQIRGRLPDGTPTTASLPFVEPVQLQVVCTRFWDRLPWAELPVVDGRPRIETGQVTELAQVDDALADYYDHRIPTIAAAAAPEAPEALERQIREWIDANLITERGTRAQLRVGAEREHALPETVIQALIDAYLVRREGRPGDRWYELAHDRMVQPITESNTAWLRAHLQPVQLQARHWHATGRRRESLLQGAILRQARAWTAENRVRLPAWEQSLLADYLDDSSREQQSRNLRYGAAVVVALLILATALFLWQDREQQALATQEIRSARIRAFLSEAQLQSARGEHRRGALLARQAFLFDKEAGWPLRDLVDDTLRQILAVDYFDAADGSAALRGHEHDVTSVAFSPDGTRLASASADQTVRLWDPGDPGAPPAVLEGHRGPVTAVAFDAAGRYVFSAGRDGALRRWSVASPTSGAPQVLDSGYRVASDPRLEQDQLLRVDNPTLAEVEDVRPVVVNAVAVSPDGQWLAAGAEFGAVLVWPLATADLPGEAELLENPGGEVHSMAFSPDSRTLVAASDRSVAVFDASLLPAGEPEFTPIPAVRAIAVSPDSQGFASASGSERTVQLRTLDDPSAAPRSLLSAQAEVRALAFSPDGRALAAAGEDGVVRLWDLTLLGREPITLRGHVGAVRSIAFAPDGRTLASGGDDATVRLWIVDTAALAAAVCDEVDTNLSDAEWRRIAGEIAWQPTCPGLPPEDASGMPLATNPAPTVEAADESGTPVASASLFPETLDLPLGQPFRIERDDTQTLEEVSNALSDSADDAGDAEELLRTWGWEESANRHYASDNPPPNAAGYVVVSVHEFASEDGAAAALHYLADVRRKSNGHNPIEVGRFGDQTEAMAGRGFNGNEVTIYARQGSRVFRVIGVAGIGDPKGDVQAALQIMLDR